MGKRLKDSRNKVMQRSIGLRSRQHEFLEHMEDTQPRFDINKLFRDLLDKQILEQGKEEYLWEN